MSAIIASDVDHLTPADNDRLAELESVVERDLATFIRVGDALLEIRDQRLYRESYASFEEYCQQRWDMSRSRAYQLMDAAKAIEEMSTLVDIELPKTERQGRELATIKDSEERAAVWEDAVSEHGQQPSATQLRETLRVREEPSPKPERTSVRVRVAESTLPHPEGVDERPALTASPPVQDLPTERAVPPVAEPRPWTFDARFPVEVTRLEQIPKHWRAEQVARWATDAELKRLVEAKDALIHWCEHIAEARAAIQA